MVRTGLIKQLAERIAGVNLGRPARIAIDGKSCSGKTRLADELVDPVRAHGRPVIRATIDGFHNPPEIRHRQGGTSPRGYYEDSFDLEAVKTCVLLPLGPGGDRSYQPARYDFRDESVVDATWQVAAADAVLIFEGVFLHRPELTPHWDFTIYVEADTELTLKRAKVRDRERLGSVAIVEQKYRDRYIPGQQIYRDECDPANRAHALWVNDDIERPRLVIRN